MAARTLVSYDDITLPYDDDEVLPSPSSLPPPVPESSGPPPSKKRKKHKKKARHCDDPSSNLQRSEFKRARRANAFSKQVELSPPLEGEGDEMESDAEEGEYDEEVDEESRELTHDEIWDDSALVYAWESAMEEYKLYHGGEGAWKQEPVKKSPLWYNVPIDTTETPATTSANTPTVVFPSVVPSDLDEDSQPLDFDTFVPSHDPSLETPSAPIPIHAPASVTENYISASPAGPMVSQDDAFSRALNAMYWGGYWTAMYYAQRQIPQPSAPTASTSTISMPSNNVREAEDVNDDEDEDEDEDDNDIADGDFISTQR